jgi:hypothetical protein
LRPRPAPILLTPMTRADWNLFWPIEQLVGSVPVP